MKRNPAGSAFANEVWRDSSKYYSYPSFRMHTFFCSGSLQGGLRGAARIFPVSALALAACLLSGCGGGGVERNAVTGKVTFEGQPVPSGEIQIMPDRAKGNKGPMGFAYINDGVYEIDSEKGAVSGPVVVRIQGADGQDISYLDGRPYGNWLFEPQTIYRDLDAGKKEWDFDL